MSATSKVATNASDKAEIDQLAERLETHFPVTNTTTTTAQADEEEEEEEDEEEEEEEDEEEYGPSPAAQWTMEHFFKPFVMAFAVALGLSLGFKFADGIGRIFSRGGSRQQIAAPAPVVVPSPGPAVQQQISNATSALDTLSAWIKGVRLPA
eukprot:TRINITY_DN2361_c0_g1_i1.p1 TRINITY_DN2361_c0_g1~~TRINITY_DN2361_c0_g1_i1.p1  ORF type:complete len:152 (+),score=37.82 TRINITY_DN2361_c0_g1_i1:28-483(+)